LSFGQEIAFSIGSGHDALEVSSRT
jgi:hypothetical protein